MTTARGQRHDVYDWRECRRVGGCRGACLAAAFGVDSFLPCLFSVCSQSWCTLARDSSTSAKQRAFTHERRRKYTRCCRRVHASDSAYKPPTTCPHTPYTPSSSIQEFADAGATVVRLKGGDPLVFGRGGEECDFLRARGVPVAVAPGITAASGIAAELGVPLTHRGVASSVRFITGHSREGGEEPSEADVTSFSPADTHATLVIYMGLGTLPSLASALLEAGLPPTTPALAVERGTTAVQRRLFGRLAGIATATQTHGMRSPTLVFIGNCVALSPLWPWPGSDGNDAGADISDARLQIGTPSLVPAAQPSRVVLPDGQVITLPPASKALRADTRAT